MRAPEPWGAIDDIARHMGISKDTFYRGIKARSLPTRKSGLLWRLKLSALDERGTAA